MTDSDLARFAALLLEPALVLSLDGRIVARNAAASHLLDAETGRLLREHAPEPASVDRCVEQWSRSGQLLPGSLRLRDSGSAEATAYRAEGARLRMQQGPDRLLVRLRPRDRAIEAFQTLNLKIEELGEEVARRMRVQSRLAGQLRLLELIARGAPLETSLDAIARFVESESSDAVRASVLLIENGRLRHGAAPNLPEAYIEAIDGLEIGPRVGSCGTAAYRRETVVVSDIANDELWSDFRELALGHGLRACWSAPVLTADGQVLATVAHYRGVPQAPRPEDEEITEIARQFAQIAIERHRAVEALRNRAAELGEMNARTNEFLAMLGHELRNPLSPIVTTLELLRLDGSGAERERWLGILERQVGLVRRLVDDLIDISRVTRGRIELQRRPIDLREVVGAVCGEGAADPRVTVTAPDAPVRVDADPQRLQQAVSNLLDNAQKFTPADGKIEIALDTAPDEARLIVRDSGAGIEPDELPVVFELFTQGARTLDRSPGGLGIGLTMVKSIVELHGGSVAARSEGHGRGSEFEVRLPLAATAAPSVRPAPARDRVAVAPIDVLIVDDDEDSAQLLAGLLGRWGHRTRVLHDGGAAVEAIARSRFDLVVLDIGLPGLDGFEVARRVRGREPLLAREATLVALTGYGQESDRERALANGFDAFLVKPVDLVELRRLIDQRAS